MAHLKYIGVKSTRRVLLTIALLSGYGFSLIFFSCTEGQSVDKEFPVEKAEPITKTVAIAEEESAPQQVDSALMREMNPVLARTHRSIVAGTPEKYDRYYNFHPSTWKKMNYIFEEADSTSEIIDSLGPHTPLDLEAFYGPTGDAWYRVKTGERSGFIHVTSFYFYKSHAYTAYEGSRYDYHNILVGLSKFKGLGSELKVVLEKQDHTVVQDFRLENVPAHFSMAQVETPSLNNINQMHRLSFVHRYSCPGVMDDRFLVLRNRGLEIIAKTWGTGEAGYYDMEMIYFPLEFRNGKKLLVRDADLGRIFDRQTASLDTIPFPEIDFPQEDLVIVKWEHAEPALDENNREKVSDNGELKVDIIGSKTTLYRWDGIKLNEVKP